MTEKFGSVIRSANEREAARHPVSPGLRQSTIRSAMAIGRQTEAGPGRRFLTVIAIVALVLIATGSAFWLSQGPLRGYVGVTATPTATPSSAPSTPPVASPAPNPSAAPSGHEEVRYVRETSLVVIWAATTTRVLRSTDAGSV